MKNDGEVPQMTHLHAHFCGYCVSCYRVKVANMRSYSGLFFSAFEFHTERQFGSLRIQSNCGKIRIRKTLNMDTFHALCLQTCASVHYSVSIYTVTTMKVIQRKNSKYCLIFEALLDGRVLSNIIQQQHNSTKLKSMKNTHQGALFLADLRLQPVTQLQMNSLKDSLVTYFPTQFLTYWLSRLN